MKRRRLIFFTGDILIVTFSFLFFVWIKPASVNYYLPHYLPHFLIFIGIWLLISTVSGKYRFDEFSSIEESLKPILISDLIILAVVSTLIIAFFIQGYSRMIYYGTIFLCVIIEMAFTIFYAYSKNLSVIADFQDNLEFKKLEEAEEEPVDKPFTETFIADYIKQTFPINRKMILENGGEKVLKFITRNITLDKTNTAIFLTSTRFNIDKQADHFFHNIINLKRINDIRYLNKFFESVNAKLPKHGLFVCCLETKNQRKKRLFKKFPPIIREIYYFFDFIYKRVFPKLKFTRQLYYFLNGGQNRVISKQEALGRLYSCGFKFIDDCVISNLVYLVVEKVKKPAFDYHPSYGAVFKMKRVGKNGKSIYVYKMRTMYPYSEYLQEYIYLTHSLDEGGKFKRDIRVTTLGKIMRKFWIDELPMLLNLLQGDMKLVGVRPLSSHYLSLYPEEARARRLKTKPGLFPPYYAHMPKNLEEVVESEMKYLDEYEKHPLLTDWRYFWKAVFNILFKRARSK